MSSQEKLGADFQYEFVKVLKEFLRQLCHAQDINHDLLKNQGGRQTCTTGAQRILHREVKSERFLIYCVFLAGGKGLPFSNTTRQTPGGFLSPDRIEMHDLLPLRINY